MAITGSLLKWYVPLQWLIVSRFTNPTCTVPSYFLLKPVQIPAQNSTNFPLTIQYDVSIKQTPIKLEHVESQSRTTTLEDGSHDSAKNNQPSEFDG